MRSVLRVQHHFDIRGVAAAGEPPELRKPRSARRRTAPRSAHRARPADQLVGRDREHQHARRRAGGIDALTFAGGRTWRPVESTTGLCARAERAEQASENSGDCALSHAPRARLIQGQRGVERIELAAARGVVARQALHGGRELVAPAGARAVPSPRRRAGRSGAGEEIALDRERHEGQLEARRLRAQAEAGVGAAVGDLAATSRSTGPCAAA